ncbi:MAG: hypothetical protein ACLQQ4_09515 [Bacteroidia bacterium]
MFSIQGIAHPTYPTDGIGRGLCAGTVQLDGAFNGILAETRAWLQAIMASGVGILPSRWYVNAVDRLIRTLIRDGNWQYLDRLWIFATEYQGASLVSLVNPNGIASAWPTNITLSPTNPTWSYLTGWATNSSTYLNTNYNPNTVSVNYVLNSASMGIGVSIGSQSSSSGDDMGVTAGGDYSVLNASITSLGEVGALNNGSTFVESSTTTTVVGFSSVMRTTSAASGILLYRNGLPVTISESGGVSVSIPGAVIFIGGINSGGSLVNGVSRTYSLAYIGGGINQQLFYNAIQQFAQTVGFVI